jgi:pimeloyl-ACP methyl ester carboxylesterase
MTTQWLELDGASIAYQAHGPPDLPALVLLHGYPTSSRLWEHVMPQALEAGVRVVAPDLPGFGQSDLWRRPADWPGYVAFLDRFFAALDLPRARFHLGVHDWGGPIGLTWATQHPAAIASLFITDTAFFPDFTWEFGDAMREPGKGEHLVERLQDWETFAKGQRRICPNASEETLRDWHRAFSSLERCHAHLELYRSPNLFAGAEGKLAALCVPTSVVWGGADPFVPPKWAQRFLQDIPRAEVHIVEGAGHFLQQDAPQEVGRLLAEHLARSVAHPEQAGYP